LCDSIALGGMTQPPILLGVKWSQIGVPLSNGLTDSASRGERFWAIGAKAVSSHRTPRSLTIRHSFVKEQSRRAGFRLRLSAQRPRPVSWRDWRHREPLFLCHRTGDSINPLFDGLGEFLRDFPVMRKAEKRGPRIRRSCTNREYDWRRTDGRVRERLVRPAKFWPEISLVPE
jgi:hypothetical protein